MIRGNRSGVVLVTVLMAIIVMSVFVTAILSQNISQSNADRDQVNRIVAEQLAKGVYWKAVSDMGSTVIGVAPAISGTTESLNGKTFSITAGVRPNPPAGTSSAYSVSVSY